jgi:hypothetical protein
MIGCELPIGFGVMFVSMAPKHGSWLNMPESELAVLTRQCLSRRIPDKQILEKEDAARERRPRRGAHCLALRLYDDLLDSSPFHRSEFAVDVSADFI